MILAIDSAILSRQMTAIGGQKLAFWYSLLGSLSSDIRHLFSVMHCRAIAAGDGESEAGSE
jgi:hypothetical protein